MRILKLLSNITPKRLNLKHLFLILLVVLLLANLGYGMNVKESLENNNDNTPDALPKGVPKSQIPEGDEDMYILKSEVVPPVCPKCPDVEVCNKGKEQCPPCPACARCPESNFECKKVPTYNPGDNSTPRPVLSDFSQFGI